jgi:carbonic anhydrase/acetyltransferase-like protein (isoleucine patch superfamily)
MSIRLDMAHHGIWPRVRSARSQYGGDVPIYALGESEPTIHPDAYVHPDAVIIGNVTIGADSTIWPGAVLRGDDGLISIGARTSIQDNSVLHTTPFCFTTVGDDCVVGHMVHLEGCTIESGVLVGNGAIVMHHVVAHTGSVIAASAVVLNGTDVPTGMIAAGVPAKLRPNTSTSFDIGIAVQSYVSRGHRFREQLRRLD